LAYFGRLTFKVTVIEDLLLADILELHLYLPVEADAAHCLDILCNTSMTALIET